MRTRNNKINVFLSDDEKLILKRDSAKLNVSQSEYIRNLIIGHEVKTPLPPKVETKPKEKEIDVDNIKRVLDENIEYLIRAKNRFRYLGYFNDERTLQTRIEELKMINSRIK